MEKTIFILREVAWTWHDEPALQYEGANEIYKKFNTYEEALAEKNRLELDRVRYDYNEYRCSLICNANFAEVNFYEIMLKKGQYEYFKDNFGIDWQGIQQSGLIDESKLKKWEFRELVNGFFLKKILQNDKHILYVLKMIELDFYEIAEVKENDCFYKIYSNKYFQDFTLRNNLYGNNITGQEVEIKYYEDQIENFYYFPYVIAQNRLCEYFYDLLSNSYYKNSLKGSFSELSEAPEILKSYIENHSEYFVYSAKKKKLTMYRIYDEEKQYEVMSGLIALLRPEKIPFIIKSFPISELPEKYLQYEEEKKGEERRKREQYNSYGYDNDEDLPF